MDNATDVILEYNGEKFPFGIQPRCRVGRMIQVVGGSLGIEIEKIIHYQNKTLSKHQYLTDPNKYLLEDYGICAGQKILIIGKKVKDGEIEGASTILLNYNEKNVPCQIFPHTTVQHILNIVRQNMDLVPDTVKLKYDGNYLNNLTKKLITDLNMKENDILEIEGTYFPISLFGKGYQFAENLGIYLDTECTVCMEKTNNMHIFKCGHANVCNGCYEAYNEENCPICKNSSE